MAKIAMIGCGKLGKTCAEVMSQTHDVVGYDPVDVYASFPILPSIADAISNRDIIFIAAPTPHDERYGGESPISHLDPKDFDYSILVEILKEINNHATSMQLIVIISTVLPGTMRQTLAPLVKDRKFLYNPYLIAMGTTEYDMINPEMVIIGTKNGTANQETSILIDFYKTIMNGDQRYVIGTWDEAESIKIFYNTFISMKIGFVNMIQDVSEKNGNINTDVVTSAIANSTMRITSSAYMKAGMGDGGACHPRDNIALRSLANKLSLGYDIFGSIMNAREIQAENLAKKCLKHGKNVTILGKSYKPGVGFTNGSSSILTGYFIHKHGGMVNYYDPACDENDLKPNWTEVYLLADPTFDIFDLPRHSTVIDVWRKYNDTVPFHLIRYGDTRLEAEK
jgi:UDPglucose 6-dehydrogenase